MIRGIFCHDLPIYKDVNGNYCSTTLTDALFSRYFEVVDELVVATRVYPINKTYEEAHQEKISLPNIKVLEMPNLNTIKGFIFERRKYSRIIFEEIKNCDLIFIRGGITGSLGVDAAWKLRKPYLVENGGCAWDALWNHSLRGKLFAPYSEYREKKETLNAAYVIYVTEKWLQKRYPTKGKWTYASNVILHKVDEIALERRLNKIKHTDKSHLVLGTTAGINKMKGQQFVIEAMNLLKNEYDIRYELVGSGDNSYLLSLAGEYGLDDKILFKGQMTHEEVLRWLDTIDIYVQPSLQEGLPRALIEAMSRACPSLGSQTAGIPELLHNSCIFKRKKPKAIAGALKMLLDGDHMEINARLNFEKAKEYELHKLEKRRSEIYKMYRDDVVKR